MSQREFDALMKLRVGMEQLFEGLSIEQMEALGANLQVVEAVAQGRLYVLDQFVPVRLQEDASDRVWPWNTLIQLRRYPVEISSTVAWSERVPHDLACDDVRIIEILRSFPCSSRETLRLLKANGPHAYSTLEQVDLAFRDGRLRPATVHHLVAFDAAYKIGRHGKPGRILATGNIERFPTGSGNALHVPHIAYRYDIDAECVTQRSLEMRKIFSEQASMVYPNDYVLAVEQT